MNYLKKKELLIGLISFVLFLISSGLAIYFYFDKDECICNDVSINTSPEISDATKKVKLEVKGEVKKPGVYEVSSDSIIQDQTTPNMIQRICRIFERNPLISKEI